VGLDFSGSASSRVGPGVDGIAGAEYEWDRRSAGSGTGHGLPLLQQRDKQFRVSNAERIGHGEQLRFGLRGGVLRRKRNGGELFDSCHGPGLFFDGVGAGSSDGAQRIGAAHVHHKQQRECLYVHDFAELYAGGGRHDFNQLQCGEHGIGDAGGEWSIGGDDQEMGQQQ
jgi:hypothetical protein